MGKIRKLLTPYGYRELDVASLHGSAVLYTGTDHTIPAGIEWDGNRKLKAPVRWRRGTILIPRLFNTDEPPGIFLWSAHQQGIYQALRALMHTKHGYSGVEGELPGIAGQPGEVQKLEDVREALDLALGWLALRPQLTRYRRDAIHALIREQVATVGQVRDPAKRQALLHMLQALHERDTKGRANPSARMAITVGAVNDLRDRLALIRFIEPRIGMRQIALLREEVRIRGIFGSAYKTVDEVRHRARMQNRFDRMTRLDLVRSELGSIRVGPYPVHIERLNGDMETAQAALREGRIGDARKTLGVVLESLRCKKARWMLEELLVKFSLFVRQRDPDPIIAAQFAREIRQFSTRVAARIDDSGFEKKVCEEVCRLLETASDMIDGRSPHLSLVRVLEGAKGLVGIAAGKL